MKLTALAISTLLILLGAVAGGSTAIALIEHRITQLEETHP